MKNNQHIEKVQLEISELNKKYNKSRGFYLLLNVALILISAFTGLVSAYAIAKNGHLPSVAVFVAISFITAFISFFTALLTIYTLSNRYKLAQEKKEVLEQVLIKLKNNEVDNYKELFKNISSSDILD